MCIYYALHLFRPSHQLTDIGVSSRAERGRGKASCRPPSRGRARVAHPFSPLFSLRFPETGRPRWEIGPPLQPISQFLVLNSRKFFGFRWKNPATLLYTFVAASVMGAL